VESDSTIAPNEEAEKASRIEFITAVGGFIQQAGGMVQQMPATAPFAAELLKFVAGSFRAGRQLDPAIDAFSEQITAMGQQAMQPQEPPPDPAMMKVQADAQAAQAKMQMDMQKAQADGQMQQAKMQADAQKMQADAQMAQAKMQMEMEKMRADIAAAQQQLALQREIAGANIQLEQMKLKSGREVELLKLGAKDTDEGEVMDKDDERNNTMLETIRLIVAEFAKVQTAPKRVVRDQAGEIVGVETVG
jgi:hypothetical protein